MEFQVSSMTLLSLLLMYSTYPVCATSSLLKIHLTVGIDNTSSNDISQLSVSDIAMERNTSAPLPSLHLDDQRKLFEEKLESLDEVRICAHS